MGMPLFYLDDDTHALLYSADLWIYFAISIPLTALSVGYWRYVVSRRRQTAQLMRTSSCEERGLV